MSNAATYLDAMDTANYILTEDGDGNPFFSIDWHHDGIDYTMKGNPLDHDGPTCHTFRNQAKGITTVVFRERGGFMHETVWDTARHDALIAATDKFRAAPRILAEGKFPVAQ